MRTSRDLRGMLHDMDRRGYPAYKGLRGRYAFDGYALSVDHVQGDPFAAPSKLSVEAPASVTRIPPALAGEPWRRVAVEDLLVRRFAREAQAYSFKAGGSGKSGLISTSRPGPEVLERSACEVGADGSAVMRFEVGLPAHGRTIDAAALDRVLFDFLPRIVAGSLVCDARSRARFQEAADLADDQHALREQMEELGLAAFVADGSVLPRESGVSSRPMRGAVPFASPESMRVTVELPHRGPVSGMGVRRGVTLVVGGGYHGKSTLLQALQAGVYDHVAGDGRELVAADRGAVKLRAEDGRAVHGVDVSMFISGLPNGKGTRSFSTPDASGSTSQAASAAEALEEGARLLLIDEDTSATNFMVRDDVMAAVVSRDQEPITPYVERVRDLWEQAGVSSVIVAGSSGAFFPVADTVVQMDCYRAYEITARAREVCERMGAWRARRAPGFALPDAGRLLDVRAGGPGERRGGGGRRSDEGPEEGVDAASGATRARRGREPGREGRLKVRSSLDGVQVGGGSADLRLVEQLVDREQAAALAQMARLALQRGLLDGRHSAREVVEEVFGEAERRGLGALDEHGVAACGMAMPRREELFALLNRWRA